MNNKRDKLKLKFINHLLKKRKRHVLDDKIIQRIKNRNNIDDKYFYTDDIKDLKPGLYIKYVNVNDSDNKKNGYGILVDIESLDGIYVLVLKNTSNGMYWKIGFRSNHIFYRESYRVTDMRDIIKDYLNKIEKEKKN